MAKIANSELWAAAELARDNRIGAWPELAAELSARLGRPITGSQLSETARKNRGPRSADARRRAAQAVIDTMAWAKDPDAAGPPDLEAANPEVMPAPKAPAGTAPKAPALPGWELAEAAHAPPLTRRQQRRRYRRLRRLVLIDGAPPTRREWRHAIRHHRAPSALAALQYLNHHPHDAEAQAAELAPSEPAEAPAAELAPSEPAEAPEL